MHVKYLPQTCQKKSMQQQGRVDYTKILISHRWDIWGEQKWILTLWIEEDERAGSKRNREKEHLLLPHWRTVKKNTSGHCTPTERIASTQNLAQNLKLNFWSHSLPPKPQISMELSVSSYSPTHDSITPTKYIQKEKRKGWKRWYKYNSLAAQ